VKTHGNVVFALLFALLMGGVLVGLGAGNFRGDAPQTPQVDGREAAPGKPSPEPAEKPKEPAGKAAAARDAPRLPAQPAVKVISLIEAITIAEKIGKGQAMKAERKDKPELSFRIELMDAEGVKNRIELTADGKLKEKKEDEPRGPDKKPGEKKGEKKPEDKKPGEKKPDEKKPDEK
jgi:hypothetical protein